jgi:undecaprenyl-diphosphatase
MLPPRFAERPIPMSLRGWMFAVLAMLCAADAHACVWSAIDHELGYDQSGVWKPEVYRGLAVSLTVAQAAGALWEGSESRFGRTMWQGMDAQLTNQIAVEIMKRGFARARPKTSDNPCAWFSSKGNQSFPSGEASSAMAFVTPYVLEYGGEHPLVYAALALPAYIGVARMKARAHWQTDVRGGWIVGAVAGAWAQGRETPLLIEILPDGISVGIRHRF